MKTRRKGRSWTPASYVKLGLFYCQVNTINLMQFLIRKKISMGDLFFSVIPYCMGFFFVVGLMLSCPYPEQNWILSSQYSYGVLWVLRRMGAFEVQDLLASECHYSPDSAQLDVNNSLLGKGKTALLLSWCWLSVWFPFIFIVYHNNTTFQTWLRKQSRYE